MNLQALMHNNELLEEKKAKKRKDAAARKQWGIDNPETIKIYRARALERQRLERANRTPHIGLSAIDVTLDELFHKDETE